MNSDAAVIPNGAPERTAKFFRDHPLKSQVLA